MILLVAGLVVAAIVYLVLLRKTPGQGRRTNRPYGEFNLERQYRKIGREIEWSWKQTAQGLYLSNQTNLTEAEKFSLQNASIEVYSIIPIEEGFVFAYAWVNNQGRPVPAIVRAALFGVPEDAVEVAQQGRQPKEGDPLPPDVLFIVCVSDGRRWNFHGWESEDGSANSTDLYGEVHAVIGEPVLIQNSYKQPPFAVTVLGPAEPVNEQLVRVPVRVTSIIPRWSYHHAGEICACLETAPDGSGKSRDWCAHNVLPEERQANCPQSVPLSLTLVKRGSYEAHLYFGPDRTGPDTAAPDEPFVLLQFMDGSDQIIEVDLTQSMEHVRRVRFEDGQPDDTWLPTAVMARLESYDDSWSYLPDPASTVLGDTVGVPWKISEQPGVDVTVLGQPETINARLVRLPVRIVARAGASQHSTLVEFQLSDTPDVFGQIKVLFTAKNDLSTNGLPDDAIEMTNMAPGEIREGQLYFVPYSGEPDIEAPGEPFSILWYGPTMYELPMNLTTTRR